MKRITTSGKAIFQTAAIFFLFFQLLLQDTQAQSLAVNTDGSTANASALLDVKSTVKGILVPRMSRTERNAIASPATGLLVFQNAPDSIGFYYYNGSSWTWMFANANTDTLAWRTGGNTGTSAATHFIGTKDNVPLVMKVNNTERARLTTNGELGIGTSTPNSSYGFAKVEIASEGFGAPTDLLVRNAANSSGYAPGLVFQHARGTLAAPLTVNSGDYLGAISSMSYDGSNYTLSLGVDLYADGPVSAGVVPSRMQFNTMNTSGSYGARLTIKNDGKTGIGTTNPNSTLQVDGTMAVGITMGVTGGPSGSPASLANAKYYIGLSPADAVNNYYQLPSPVSFPGRIYVIRNNSSANPAVLTTAAGLLFPGSSATGGASYTLNATVSVKTVMVISDGANWTVMQQD